LKISSSLLACDFANFGQEVQRLTNAGADFLHFDIMDGCFVSNITFGPGVVSAVRRFSNLPFEIHLMTTEPIRLVERFISAGGDVIIFHLEATSNVASTIREIKNFKKKVGLAVCPKTSVSEVLPFLETVDMVTIMTVEPGAGGQSFIKSQILELQELVRYASSMKIPVLFEVDGGINPETAKISKNSGADILVAGTFLFSKNDLKSSISELK
jgi:ribulose-phosphate 3-epimerase